MKFAHIVFAGIFLATAAQAQNKPIDYGTNGGDLALNGVCDDRRFDGVGTADARNWDALGKDAQDCREAVTAGTAHLWTVADGIARSQDVAVDFGDNQSEYADDSACDDPRFEGHGATESPYVENIGHDANDCRRLFEFGQIFMRDINFTDLPEPEVQDPLYGDNSGDYPFDGECDDRRFVGEGMAGSLGWKNTGKDAQDCRELAEAGKIHLIDQTQAGTLTDCTVIDFGDDSSEYAQDGTCDDYRFDGLGAAPQILLDYIGGDATDCRRMCDYGLLFLRDLP